MRQFDDFLRQGLMEANLAEYREDMDQLPAPEFSPRYRRERMRLLADPWKWVKRRERPMWKRIAKNAACVLLACTVAFGALMAASPAVRAAVQTWLRQITQNDGLLKVEYEYAPGILDKSDPPAAPWSPWRLTWLPEGWGVDDVRSSEGGESWVFYKIVPEDGFDKSISFDTNSANGASWGMWIQMTPEEYTSREQLMIHDRPADHYQSDLHDRLIWVEEDETLLCLTAHQQTETATLKRFAESAAPWTGTPVEYEVGWVPEGNTDGFILFLNGIGSGQWMEHHVPLTFTYINDPACPFRVPDRASEEVTVNGLPGLFWPSIISMEEKAAKDESYDPDHPTIYVYDIPVSAVLTWEDPETHTIFRIDGIQEKEDMLRMAESVTRKTS